jgi:hypothetical protein
LLRVANDKAQIFHFTLNQNTTTALTITPKVFEVGLGVGYENGDNPEENISNIDLLTLSLQAKF